MSEDEAGAPSPVLSPKSDTPDAASVEKLKDLIVRDRDQIVQKGLGFFDELSQKELHLAEQIRSLEAAMSNLKTLTVKASRQHIAKEMRRKAARKKTRVFRKPKQPSTPSPKAPKRIIKKQKKAPKEEVIELSPGYIFTPDYEAKDPVSVMFMRKGPRRTTFKNGDVKMEFPDGTTKTKHEGMTFTKYANGDYQQDYEDGTTYYRYNSNKSLEMRLTNGDVILLFENGQKEEYFSSGRSRITCVDGTIITKE